MHVSMVYVHVGIVCVCVYGVCACGYCVWEGICIVILCGRVFE